MTKEYYVGEEASEKAATLKEVKKSADGWDTYYIDEKTNEKFIMLYLESHLQGGGPPRLIKLSDFPFS